MRYGWQLRLWVPFYNTCFCRKTWWGFFLLAWCAVFVPSHTNGVAKCQKSDVTNFYIRLVFAPRTLLLSLWRCWTILTSWLLKLKTSALHATFCATCIFWVFPHLQTLKAENASFYEQICCILLLHCTGKGVPSSILNPPMGNKVTEKIGLGWKNPPLEGNFQKLRI